MDRLPFARGQDLLALAPRYRQLHQQAPVSRVWTPAGIPHGWSAGTPRPRPWPRNRGWPVPTRTRPVQPRSTIRRCRPSHAKALAPSIGACGACWRRRSPPDGWRCSAPTSPIWSSRSVPRRPARPAGRSARRIVHVVAGHGDLRTTRRAVRTPRSVHSAIPSDPHSAVGRARPAASRPRRSHHRRTHPARHLVTPGPATHHV